MTTIVDLHPVQVAHGDAWQADGLARISSGGGVLTVRGARAAASGIPTPKWNNADLSSPGPDWDGLTRWYAAIGVPWGVRVPVQFEGEVTRGRAIFHKRGFELRREWLRAAALPYGLLLREAAAGDLDRLAAVDAAAFGEDSALSRRYIAPTLAQPGFTQWLLERAGEPVALALTIATDGEAGRAAMLTSLAVLAPADAGLLLPGLIASVAHEAFAAAAEFVHLHTGDDREAALWTRLGAREVPGFAIRLMEGLSR